MCADTRWTRVGSLPLPTSGPRPSSRPSHSSRVCAPQRDTDASAVFASTTLIRVSPRLAFNVEKPSGPRVLASRATSSSSAPVATSSCSSPASGSNLKSKLLRCPRGCLLRPCFKTGAPRLLDSAPSDTELHAVRVGRAYMSRRRACRPRRGVPVAVHMRAFPHAILAVNLCSTSASCPSPLPSSPARASASPSSAPPALRNHGILALSWPSMHGRRRARSSAASWLRCSRARRCSR
jgi:hypothetical protein